MPIPLDIANLATTPMADDLAERLDLANLNAASQDDAHQEPQVSTQNGLEVRKTHHSYPYLLLLISILLIYLIGE